MLEIRKISKIYETEDLKQVALDKAVSYTHLTLPTNCT